MEVLLGTEGRGTKLSHLGRETAETLTKAKYLLGLLACSAAASGAYAASPSFDCRKAINPLTLTICASADASAADWQLVSSYWATYATKDGADRLAFRDAHVVWLKSIDAECGLVPRTSGNDTKAACVADLYRGRASAYRQGLSGDAQYEAELGPDVHRSIQASLNALGYSNQGEGVFGASTRQAISSYRASIGQQPAAFLTRRQVAGLLGGVPRADGRAAQRVQGEAGPNPQEAAAQELIMGVFGGFARSRGIPLPAPSARRQAVAPPISRGAERYPESDADVAGAPDGLAKANDRFGDQGSVAFSPPATHEASGMQDAGVRTVEVTGSGESVEEAKKDASRQAVQQVAGLYVDARRRVETKDGDAHATAVVEEKIVSYTNAYVRKVEILKTDLKGSSATVRERVSVAVAPLIKVLQDNAVPTVAFDTDSAVGTVDSLAQEKRGAMDMYADLLTRTASLVSVGVGKPEIDPSLPSGPDQSWLSIPVTFKVNLDARREWRSKFEIFAKEKADVEVPIAKAKINNQSDTSACSVPYANQAYLTFSRNKSFLNDNLQAPERGVAACFLDSDFDNPAEARCFGRRFILEQASIYDPCRRSGPCLFLKEQTKKVRLVFEMLDKAGHEVVTAKLPFDNFPAINLGNSSSKPINGRNFFFNYCAPHQTAFYAETSRERGPTTYGDVLLFPAEDSQLRAYYNQLIPNDKIGQIASISAKFVQDN